MSISPKNILLINFGQIGDVIMSLPAAKAVKEHFNDSRITIMTGKSARAVIEMSRLADDLIVVDRVALRDSGKIWSIRQIIGIIKDVRSRKFDFVIDLHSLTETNLLGYLSGSPKRLYQSRNNRSLDFLSNFRPKPQPYKQDLHLTESYFQVLEPLGISNNQKEFRIIPSESDLKTINSFIHTETPPDKKFVGVNLGAGHPSRHWKLENYCGLIEKLAAQDGIEVMLFSGPEEENLRENIAKRIPPAIRHFHEFNLKELAGAFSTLDAVVGNDTGPIHLAGAVGTPVVLIVGANPIIKYIPRAGNLKLVDNAPLNEISVDDVFEAVISVLRIKSTANRNNSHARTDN